jgi:hypothetical protein
MAVSDLPAVSNVMVWWEARNKSNAMLKTAE